MGTDAQIRNELNLMSRLLLHIHKSLIDSQKAVYEKQTGKTPTPNEAFNLLLNHTDFEWLRKISGIIVEIDEAIDNPESYLSKTKIQVAEKISEHLFSGSDTSVTKQIDAFASKDEKLRAQLNELRQMLLVA